ncbi:probable aspartic protease At2g35615 [Solanum tuberosum]|uniref:probable aspartic protease At2g35615 n=1 Tax=Solanum tuberosum TaxID=4113 RepID=UPI00073A4756|nr:PREDICTED: probable aspartic protease At2g35615 [Solanum tuberosum]
MLKGQCGVSGRCDYTYKYVTGVTEGNLASEVVTFESRNGLYIKRLMFGCSSNYSKAADRFSGVVGLGQRAISLVSQLNYTGFSYCIGGMLVDSRATSTYLPDIAFNKLKEEIRSVIGTTLKESFVTVELSDLKNFSTIALHLIENAKMKFAVENLF